MKRPMWSVARATELCLSSAVSAGRKSRLSLLGTLFVGACLGAAAVQAETSPAYSIKYELSAQEPITYQKVRITATDRPIYGDAQKDSDAPQFLGHGETLAEKNLTGSVRVGEGTSATRLTLTLDEAERQRFQEVDNLSRFYLEFYALDESSNWYISGYGATTLLSMQSMYLVPLGATSQWTIQAKVVATHVAPPVPEPGSGLLLLVGGALLSLRRRR